MRVYENDALKILLPRREFAFMLAPLQTRSCLTVFYSKMEYKDLFKATGIRSLGELLAKRSESLRTERQEKQRELFWGRVVASHVSPSPCTKAKEIEKKKNSRVEMLKKWKSEKMKRLEEAKKKQKPAFRVGVVQRKVTGSPMLTQRKACIRNNLLHKQCHVKSQISESKEKKVGVMTRARARNMATKPVQSQEVNSKPNLNNKFCKIDKNKRQQVNSHTFKVPEVVCKLPCSSLTLAYSPKFAKKGKKLVASKVKAAAVQSVQSKEDVPKENIPMKEASAETKTHSTKLTKKNEPLVVTTLEAAVQSTATEQQSKEDVLKENIPVQNENSQMKTPEKPQADQDDFRPIHYSPFVTVRSSKKSGRKSKKKLTMLDVEEQIKKEEREFQCRIFSFRKYIDCETKRLMETCDKWKHIYQEFPELPSDVEGDIDSAVGKTKLLTSDKFTQFRGLIDKCENGDPFVKVDDLQGFQDWVSIEVERIDEEFHKLEKRKRYNWKQEVAPPARVAKKQPVKALKNADKKPLAKSNIRSHILAARKLLKEGNANGGDESQLPVTFPEEESTKPKTPRKEQSLLREVLNADRKSSARKSRNSGLEIMMATQKNKFPTPAKVQKSAAVTDFEVLFGEEQTPSRSILKKTPKAQSSSKPRVTFKKLSEKYFQPVLDSDEDSPMRTVLGDLGNLTVSGMRTRSRTRQMSLSASMSPVVK